MGMGMGVGGVETEVVGFFDCLIFYCGYLLQGKGLAWVGDKLNYREFYFGCIVIYLSCFPCPLVQTKTKHTIPNVVFLTPPAISPGKHQGSPKTV